MKHTSATPLAGGSARRTGTRSALALAFALLAFFVAAPAAVANHSPSHPLPDNFDPFAPEKPSETPEPAEPKPAPKPKPKPEPQPDGAPPQRVETKTLSNETTSSQWAYVMRRTWARGAPRIARGNRLKQLRPYTRHGSQEVVLLLRQMTLKTGKVWVKVRLPMRPANRTGWVERRDLGRFYRVTKHLEIDRRSFRATLYDGKDRAVWSAPIGVGQGRWPTPKGNFYARERLIVSGSARGVYGPFAFGTSAYSNVLKGSEWAGGQIGIHGTGQPGLLPGRVSHGCVRMRNDNIQRLRKLMPLGTPIQIR